jgi:CBS domain-containing protein
MAVTVRDIMDGDPVRRGHIRLPVIEHGRLVGVVTRVDVLEALSRDQE